jgi:hypothetical protein
MHRHLALPALAGLLALLLATPARADAQEQRAFQLSLFDPVQIVPASEGISGLRLNLLYGRNASLTGIDVGLVNVVSGDAVGFQWGAVGVTGSFLGFQDNLVNINQGKLRGLQVGFFNHAERVEGLQLGLVNHAGTIHGLQIGFVNVIDRGGWLPVCVIVNGSIG